jgi:hypothetical protein
MGILTKNKYYYYYSSLCMEISIDLPRDPSNEYSLHKVTHESKLTEAIEIENPNTNIPYLSLLTKF